MLTLAETGHQDIINKFGEEFEFRIGSSFKKKNLEVDTEEIDFTNEATIKLAESKETFEINYNEQNGTWSLEIVKSSYHVNTGEFDNFETSNSGELTLNPEFVELASMMKTSLSQENGINNLNHTS
ncbi:9515_t:CDS:2 [Entrophospora sp. SA101]|nr:9515_t:CDS:2 [Entrophospora sp. SA101]